MKNREYTKGSVLDQTLQLLSASDDPWIAVALINTAAVRTTVRDKPTSVLIVRYHQLLLADKTHEAKDTANAIARGISWTERARDSQQDAAHDMEKAAIEEEFAVRRITEAEVFGGLA